MSLEDPAKNAMLDHLASLVSHASAHSAFPASGANELAGGTPAYARKAIAFNAAASGSMSKTATAVVFDIEGGDTVAAIALWSALTVGTLYGGADVTDEAFGGQGTYTLTNMTVSIT